MKKRLLFSIILVLGGVFSWQLLGGNPPQPPRGGEDAPVFVYIHGFGGAKESPKFYENLCEFLSEEKIPSDVINYEWDSVEVDVLRAGASWVKSQENADAEAQKFRTDVIDQLEKEGRPYVLVGFSVGSRVILKSLESVDTQLEGLQGVYFLGSAMNKDTTLKNRAALPDGMKITNYHSPFRDLVHRVSFNFMSDVPGGGQVGFDDTKVFENLPVSCAHAHKGLGIAADYSGLAEAIAYLELYELGQIIPGRTKMNWESSVMEGGVWWNKLDTVRVSDGNKDVAVELQQHTVRPGYFRAIKVHDDGDRTRIARGENLHAILKKLGIPAGRS